MTTFNGFKKKLKEGTKLSFHYHMSYVRHENGRPVYTTKRMEDRTVVKCNGYQLVVSVEGKDKESYLTWPKASDAEVIDDGNGLVIKEGETPLLTYRIIA